MCKGGCIIAPPKNRITGRLIFDLCGGTGAWSEPYKKAGYKICLVDWPNDVRLFNLTGAHGILAAPPCDDFAAVGSRWWNTKGEEPLLNGLSIVDACLRIVWANRRTLQWWALENPKGRLRRYLGPSAYTFNPCDFGDPWTKHTELWGHFNELKRNNVVPKYPVHRPKGSRDRTSMLSSTQKEERAKTPCGFAQAFFEANP